MIDITLLKTIPEKLQLWHTITYKKEQSKKFKRHLRNL